MDVHKVSEVSVEDIRNAHRKGMAVQKKYGVTLLQYWFSKERNRVYYLMEGPDKKSCAAAHEEAMGYAASQIEEVEGGEYDLFREKYHLSDHALSRRKHANLDAGYRFILMLDILSRIKNADTVDIDQLKNPTKPKYRALQYISDFEGKEFRTAAFDEIVAVFKTPKNVLQCAHKIQTDFLKRFYNSDSDSDDIIFNMGISVEQPHAESEGSLVDSIRMSQRLCMTAWDFEIITSKLFDDLCDVDNVIKKYIGLRIIDPSEKEFLDQLVDIIEEKLSENSFGVDYLSHSMGVSQPQLYRKVFAIAGRSPVFFIREIRLNKSLSLIKENKYNLSEIALEVGFNNPSYFSKCFKKKFGVNASKIVV